MFYQECIVAAVAEQVFVPDESPEVAVPVALTAVPAGFPSPAQDYFDGSVDLNKHLILDRTSTFVVRVSGDSMTGAGIYDGDELIIDRSLQPEDGNIVIAILDGELTVKRLRVSPRGVALKSENPDYPDIMIPEGASLDVWGVATRCLHKLL